MEKVPSDIKLIITNGEGYNAEFKVSVPSKVREIIEEVCAFANAGGGIILIGVDDDNIIKGITIDNAKRSAIQNSLGEISPMLDCTLSFADVDGKTIGIITIELFDDRIEISNPGGLVSAISRADFGKRSYSRNPLIFNLFTRINMVEQIGSGITRKDLMKGVGLPEPSYSTEDMFTVTFKRPIKTSEKTSEKILRLIKDTPLITIKDLAERLNKSTRTIEINLQKLKTDKRIERIGADKGGHWQIND